MSTKNNCNKPPFKIKTDHWLSMTLEIFPNTSTVSNTTLKTALILIHLIQMKKSCLNLIKRQNKINNKDNPTFKTSDSNKH